MLARRPKPTPEEVRAKSALYDENPGRAYLDVQTAKDATAAVRRELNETRKKLKKAEDGKSSQRFYWMLGVVPAVCAGLRILIVSRGEPAVLASLLQNINVLAVFLATILPFAAMAVGLLFMPLMISWYASSSNTARAMAQSPGRAEEIYDNADHEWRKPLMTALFVVSPVAGVLGWYGLPVKYVIWSVVLSVLLLLAFMAGRSRSRLQNFMQTLTMMYVVVVMISGLVLVLTQSGTWLPRERLTLGWWQTGPVYVLSADDWFKYLDEETREVKIVRGSTVSKREVLADPDHWPDVTLSELRSR